MIITNHERICRMFTVLRDELAPFVVSALEKTDGADWEKRMRETLRRDDSYYGSGTVMPNLDIAALLLLITFRMQDCFAQTYRLGHGPRGYVSELREMRNKWAHQVQFDDQAAARAIETANLLIKSFGGANVQELIDLREEIVAPMLPITSAPRKRSTALNVNNDKSDDELTDNRSSFAARVAERLMEPLIKRRGSMFATRDGNCRIVCTVSKIHDETGHTRYWYTIEPNQIEFLEGAQRSYIAFGCSTIDKIVLLPLAKFLLLQDQLNASQQDGRHVHLIETPSGIELILKGGDRVSMTAFLIPSHKGDLNT